MTGLSMFPCSTGADSTNSTALYKGGNNEDHKDGWIELATGMSCFRKWLRLRSYSLGQYRFLMDGHSSWPEARAQCRRVGGFLAEFESFEEHIHVTNMIGFCRWLYFPVLSYIEGSLTFFLQRKRSKVCTEQNGDYQYLSQKCCACTSQHYNGMHSD